MVEMIATTGKTTKIRGTPQTDTSKHQIIIRLQKTMMVAKTNNKKAITIGTIKLRKMSKKLKQEPLTMKKSKSRINQIQSKKTRRRNIKMTALRILKMTRVGRIETKMIAETTDVGNTTKMTLNSTRPCYSDLS